MHFDYATATKIIFGSGTIKESARTAAKFGNRVLVVSGKNAADDKPLFQSLAEAGMDYRVFEVSSEPTIPLVDEGTQIARDHRSDAIIGFGGGSVMDAAKAISAMMTNLGSLIDYLEVVGAGRKISQPPLPVIAIPTTAGTGAEVTRNAVIGSIEHRMKISLRSPMLAPQIALVDPELTHSMPAPVTASTGMDALTQVIEPFVSARANPLVDAICLEGIRYGARSLLKAYSQANDYEAREEMSLASLFGGLALSNAGLGAVHGFASPIGGMFKAPHGAVCAKLLAPVVAANVRAITQINRDLHDFRVAPEIVLHKYQEVARIVTGNRQADLKDGILWLEALCESLQIPGLSDYGVSSIDFEELVEKASIASSMQTNPVKLGKSELQSILEQCL